MDRPLAKQGDNGLGSIRPSVNHHSNIWYAVVNIWG